MREKLSDDYRPDRFSLSNSEVRATGLLGQGAVQNMACELLALRQSHAELVDALQESRPYVANAYECAFPNQQRNDEILDDVDAGLANAAKVYR